MQLWRGTLLFVVVSVVSAARSDANVAAGPASLRWLAVGDSYSSGEGLPDTEEACSLSPSAYAPLVSTRSGAGWTVEQFIFSACTGAVSGDWPSQRAVWGAGQPNVITATFGGNDIGFAAVFKDCIGLDDGIEALDEFSLGSIGGLYLGRGCDISESEIMDRIDKLQPRLRRLYQSMADVVGPDGDVFIVGYPAPVARTGVWEDNRCEGISRDDGETLIRASGRLNEVIRHATETRSNVHFVDVAPAFEGHGRCSGDEWIYGLRDGLDGQDTAIAGLPLIETARPFHPNEAGHLAIAAALEQAFNSELG